MAVYIAMRLSDGLVKIGTSKTPEKRIKEVAARCKSKMVALRTMEGGHQHERWVHQHFSANRVTGEWFHFATAMMTFEIPRAFLCEIVYATENKKIVWEEPAKQVVLDHIAHMAPQLKIRSAPLLSKITGISVETVRRMKGGHGRLPTLSEVEIMRNFIGGCKI